MTRGVCYKRRDVEDDDASPWETCGPGDPFVEHAAGGLVLRLPEDRGEACRASCEGFPVVAGIQAVAPWMGWALIDETGRVTTGVVGPGGPMRVAGSVTCRFTGLTTDDAIQCPCGFGPVGSRAAREIGSCPKCGAPLDADAVGEGDQLPGEDLL